MRITLKLFATLGQFLPADAKANAVEVEVSDGATAHAVFEEFDVPREKLHLVMLNGVYLDAREREEQVIAPGDVLAAWPPVAGG